MRNYKNEKNILCIGSKEICFHYTIDKVLEVSGLFVVYLSDQHITDVSRLPLNNVYAVDSGGNIIWQINDIIQEDALYTGIRINEANELIINNFAGFAFIIDPITRIVTDTKFHK